MERKLRQLMKRQVIATFLVIGLAATACGSDTTDPGTDPTGGDPTNGSGPPQSDVEIVYWNYHSNESGQEAVRRTVAAFEEATGITVDVDTIPLDQYNTTIVTGSEGGRLPDTGQILYNSVPDMVALGVVQDLTDLVAQWEGRDTIPQIYWDFCSVDDRIYGVPQSAFVPWMYYRKDWLEEINLEVPVTWEDFEAVSIAMTDPSRNRYGHAMRGGAGGGAFLIWVIESFGTEFVENGSVALQRQPLIDALSMYAGIFTEHGAAQPTAPSDSFQQLFDSFATGETGLWMHHTGSYQDVVDVLEPDVEFGTAVMPSGPGGAAGSVIVQCQAIFDTDHVEESFAWLTFQAEKEANLTMFELTGHFPASMEAANDPIIIDDPIYATAVEAVANARLSHDFEGKSAFESEVLLPAFQAILVGQLTPEQAADQILDGLAEIIGQ